MHMVAEWPLNLDVVRNPHTRIINTPPRAVQVQACTPASLKTPSRARTTQYDISHAYARLYTNSPSILLLDQLIRFAEDCSFAPTLTC